jgi:multidrug efflux system membrane fusion protein
MRPTIRVAARYAPLAALAVLWLAGCGGDDSARNRPPPEVSVAPVIQRSITGWVEFTGHVEAIESAEIRPRVGGHLRAVHFREGGLVKAGDPLFSIDDREYRAAVEAARADRTRAQARIDLARQELARAEALIEARAVSQGELEARQGELRQADADLLAARAHLARAELELEFTRITAPFAGRAGAALIKPGNLVHAGESVLTTLMSVDPVHVVFTADERSFLRYQETARTGRHAVLVGLANGSGFPHRGTMDFVDNALDTGTGTIRARAVVPNPDDQLAPGLSARVRVLDDQARDVLLVHEQAILTDQDHRYVYVVTASNSAERRDLQLGLQVDSLRVVESGLAAGDRIIVSGGRKVLASGQPVSPHEVRMEEPNRDGPH